MEIIKLNTANCQNCYKCIRQCPIKAIAFQNGRAQIMENECVLCGACLMNCPQNAKYIRSNVSAVRELLRCGKPVYVTLAPSWVGWYDRSVDFKMLSAAMKKLGFTGVEETAIGAWETSKQYARLMEEGQMQNLIVTACSSVVMLVENRYPELIPWLAPVSSPMMTHARLMREAYGDIRVVFVGPCLSKMQEAGDVLSGGLVDQVLTFEDLDRWMEQEGVCLEERDENATGLKEPVARLYPKPLGIIDTIKRESFNQYRPVSVDGLDRVMELFETMKQGEVEHLFVEANLCPGACVGGPVMRMKQKNVYAGQCMVSSRNMIQDKNPAKTAGLSLSYPRVFADRSPKTKEPTDEDIQRILFQIGKTTPDKELNCGSCGYPTCRDKARAVFMGKADITMCMPYLRERAENLSNTILEHSPNAIIAFDEDLCVLQLNPQAEALFHVTQGEAIGKPLSAFYGETGFEQARSGQAVVEKKEYNFDIEKDVEKSIIYIGEHRMYIAFVKDITEEQKQKERMEQMREHTVETAQRVIDKQMRVAQEIASLLGETTAETKTALTKLKKSVDIEAL